MAGWERRGECPPSVCRGSCCQHTGMWFDKTPENESFLYAQQVRGFSVKEVGDKYLLDLNKPCQFVNAFGLCILHKDMKPSPMLPKRPDFCAEWPTEPANLTNDPQCGFYFVWVDDDGVEHDGPPKEISQHTLRT